MSCSILGFLQHILNETQYLKDRAEGISKAEFLEDETLKRDRVAHPHAHDGDGVRGMVSSADHSRSSHDN
jgi:hypothetical protein